MPTRAAIACLLAVATVAVYGQVRGHEFVDYDDLVLIVNHPLHAAPLSARSATTAFTTGYHLNWTPLTSLSLQLDSALWGRRPAPFLLENVALHLLTTLLLFGFFERATGDRGRSAFVAAVFAVHPLHVESVAWASSRKDVLCGFFSALTLVSWGAWVRQRSLLAWSAALAAFACALLSKATATALPFALVLLEVWPLGRTERRQGGAALRRTAVETLPFFALAAAVGAITFYVQREMGAMSFGDTLSVGERFANALASWGLYLRDAVWPMGLAAFYPHTGEAAPLWRSALVALALLAVTAACLARARSRPAVAVGWLWYLGTLVPTIGLVQVGSQARADRYMYLPLVGLAIAVAWAVPDRWLREARGRRVAIGCALGAVSVLGVLAHQQVGHWRDSIAVFRRIVEVSPDHPFGHRRLAVAYRAENRLDDAGRHYEAVFRLDPDSARPHFEWGSALERTGQRALAIEQYRVGVEIDPDHARGRGFLGLALLGEGRAAEADPHLAFAQERYPRSYELVLATARVDRALGRREDAARGYRRALALRPGAAEAESELEEIAALGDDGGGASSTSAHSARLPTSREP